MGSASSLVIANPCKMNEAKQSQWLPVENLLDVVEEGDLVEIKRDLYMHWAVYHKDGYVIHLSAPESLESGQRIIGDKLAVSVASTFSSSSRNGAAVVQRSSVVEVVGPSALSRVNNIYDIEFQPFDPYEITNRALNEYNSIKYNLIFANCEHFATYCRYGTKFSSQSSLAKSVAIGTAALLATGSGVVGIVAGSACFLVCKKANVIWNRAVRGRVNW